MATLTIRQLDDAVKEKLRVRAAQAGRSMEEEAREILSEAVGERYATGPEFLAMAQELFGDGKGVDLDLPRRGVGDRPPPDFGIKRRPARKK